MRIVEKINLDKEGLIEHGAINIVVFGDSVTHGAVSDTMLNYETAYWNRLRRKLNDFRMYVPVNIINAGIGGTTARSSLGRMDKQVLSHNPDLIIVCFGLNDVNDPIEDYVSALEEIFTKAVASGAEVIFMTPNMLNTSVSEKTYEPYRDYAVKTAEMQNGGRMDSFMEAGKAVAKKTGVKVCDCYGEWKKLAQTRDITPLLANYINHPIPEMHQLFADMLYDTIFSDTPTAAKSESTMTEKTSQ